VETCHELLLIVEAQAKSKLQWFASGNKSALLWNLIIARNVADHDMMSFKEAGSLLVHKSSP
jgi:hypothetical protein